MVERAAYVVLLAMGVLGCERGVDKPKPPDMTDLVLSYSSPDGTFDQATASDVASGVQDVLEQFNDLGINSQVDDFFDSIQDNVDSEPENETQGEVDVDGNKVMVEGEAFLEIDRICDGWGATPVADREQNGSLMLNVNLTDVSVDPVIWASASKCRYLESDVPILIDRGSRSDVGDLRIYVGNNASIDKLGTSTIVVDVDLKATIDDVEVDVDFDVKITVDPAGVQVRIPLGDGDIIVGTSEDTIVSVLAGNGTFSCDNDGVCTSETGDAVQL